MLPGLMSSLYKDLNDEQKQAIELLHSNNNVFLTGKAGTGKSYTINSYLKGMDDELVPVLASTGAAAVLIGGRTFHSFFGLGIMEGGAEQTIERAMSSKKVVKRIRKANALVIDEISMIPGSVLDVAEAIARYAREDEEAWGGLKIITVGDFYQLPPITRGYGVNKDWAFLSNSWMRSNFQTVCLNQVMRSEGDDDFIDILNFCREGQWEQSFEDFLESKIYDSQLEAFEGTSLLSRKAEVDKMNQYYLDELEGEEYSFSTKYSGDKYAIKSLKRNLPISDELVLKVGALVMIRQNDPMGRWVNGSQGRILAINDTELTIELLDSRRVKVKKAPFTHLDADGVEKACARNFPISLAWAITIHKAQGCTLDKALVDLSNLWEPGQAYVALSRVRSGNDLYVKSWSKNSVKVDSKVKEFYQTL